jgi:hypothetical protein
MLLLSNQVRLRKNLPREESMRGELSEWAITAVLYIKPSFLGVGLVCLSPSAVTEAI